MKRSKDAVLTITIDVSGFQRAIRGAVDVIARFAESFTSQGRLKRRRVNEGGMGTDAARWPEEWQSTICAGLLCSIAPCPSDAHDLGCTHSCHAHPTPPQEGQAP